MISHELIDQFRRGFPLDMTLTIPDEPEDILSLRPSIAQQTRVTELLKKNRTSGLNANEQREWEQYQHFEHVVRLAKARAILRMQGKHV
jgi:hypothetical protein